MTQPQWRLYRLPISDECVVISCELYVCVQDHTARCCDWRLCSANCNSDQVLASQSPASALWLLGRVSSGDFRRLVRPFLLSLTAGPSLVRSLPTVSQSISSQTNCRSNYIRRSLYLCPAHPSAGPTSCRIGPIHLLAGWRKRRHKLGFSFVRFSFACVSSFH